MLLHSPFPRPSSAFVGRSDELRRILQLIPTAPLFLVYGPPGIGKSELVYKAVEETRKLAGFAPTRSVLQTAERGQSVGEFLSLLLSKLRAHGRAPPKKRAAASPEPAASAPDLKLEEMLLELCQLLEDPEQPFLLFLDDLHHLEEPRQVGAFLGQLSRQVRASRVFAASQTQLTLPADAEPAVLLRLPPLSDAESAQLVEQLALRSGVAGLSTREVLSRAQGSPELIRRFSFQQELAVAEFLVARFVEAPRQREPDGIAAVELLLPEHPQQALDSLRQIFPHLHASAHDERVVSLIQKIGESLPAQLLDTELLLARLHLRRGQLDKALALFAAQEQSKAAHASAHRLPLLCEALARSGKLREAAELLRAARRESATQTEREQLAPWLLPLVLLLGEWHEARGLAAELAQARPSTNALHLATRTLCQSLGLLLEDEIEEAAKQLDQTARELIEHDAPDLALFAALLGLLSQAACDQVSSARALLDHLEHQAATRGLQRTALLDLLRGIVKFLEGELSGARRFLGQAAAALTESHDRLLASLAEFFQAQALLGLGDLEGALGSAQRALLAAQEFSAVPLLHHAELVYAKVLLCGQQATAASTRLERLLLESSAADFPQLREQALSMLAEAEAVLGSASPRQAQDVAEHRMPPDLGRARLARQTELRPAQHFATTLHETERFVFFAIYPTPSLDWSSQLERVQKALDHYMTAGRRYEQARAALALAALLLVKNPQHSADSARADDLLGRVLQLCTRHAYGLLHLRGFFLEAALKWQQENPRRARLALQQGLRSAGVNEECLEFSLLAAASRELQGKAAVSTPLPDELAAAPEKDERWLSAVLAQYGLRSEKPYEIFDRSGSRDADERERQLLLERRELIVELDPGGLRAASSTAERASADDRSWPPSSRVCSPRRLKAPAPSICFTRSGADDNIIR